MIKAKTLFRFAGYGFITVSFLLIIAALIFHFQFFSTKNFLSTLESVGQYGDFIGGVFGTILTLLNIGIFILLTIAIQDLSDKNNQANIQAVREATRIQLRYEEFRNFKSEIDEILKAWKHQNYKNQLFTPLEDAFVKNSRIYLLYPELTKHESYKYMIDTLGLIRKEMQANQEGVGKRSTILFENAFNKVIKYMAAWVIE